MAKAHYTCQICNTQFVSQKKSPKFCSTSCYRVFQKTDDYKAVYQKRIKHRHHCANCNKEVIGSKTKKRDGETADNKFCNRACYDEYRSKIRQEIVGYCKHCNKELIAGIHRSAVYCSMQCRKDNKRIKPTNCVHCGVLFTAIKVHKKADGTYRISGCSSNTTCSDECRNMFMRTNEERKEKISRAFIGENHPNWQGGSHKIGKRGAGWASIRRAVMKRDNYKCCHCGINREQQYQKYGRDFSINHKIPFHQYGNTVKANRLNNLETLCDSCHTKADWAYRKQNPIQMVLKF